MDKDTKIIKKPVEVDPKALQWWVTIPQLAFLKWYGLVDFKDAAIVAYVLKLYESDDEKVNSMRVNSKPWINLKTLLRGMPLLRFGYRQLQQRLDNLVEIGLLNREIRMDRRYGWKRVHLQPAEKFLIELEKARDRTKEGSYDDDSV